MRNVTALVILVVAVMAGAAAVFLANRWMSEQAGVKAGAQVVVAATDLELGTQLTPQVLQVVGWPRESVPQGAFSDPKDLLEKKDGPPARVLKFSVHKGEPVSEAKLAPVGAKGGLASLIAAGKRAMTVSVNEIVGVAGFALPGNYVDILVSTQEERAGDAAQQISKIVLQRVLVLAVAQETQRDPDKLVVVSAVTLEVTPGQAEKIDLARSVGSLTLVLRSQVDTATAETLGARKAQLLTASFVEEPVAAPNEAAQPAAPPKRAKPAAVRAQEIEVIRGVTVTTVK